MLETAARRSAGCPLAAARLTLAFDGSAASLDQMADVHQIFSPASGAACCILEVYGVPSVRSSRSR